MSTCALHTKDIRSTFALHTRGIMSTCAPKCRIDSSLKLSMRQFYIAILLVFLRVDYISPSLRWTIKQYPDSLCYHILYLTIEMLNDGSRKNKSKLLFFTYYDCLFSYRRFFTDLCIREHVVLSTESVHHTGSSH